MRGLGKIFHTCVRVEVASSGVSLVVANGVTSMTAPIRGRAHRINLARQSDKIGQPFARALASNSRCSRSEMIWEYCAHFTSPVREST